MARKARFSRVPSIPQSPPKEKVYGPAGQAVLDKLSAEWTPIAEKLREYRKILHDDNGETDHEISLLSHLYYSIERGVEEMARFADDFTRAPAYAFSWSNSRFEVAAQLDICGRFGRMFVERIEAKEDTIQGCYEIAKKEIKSEIPRRMRETESSTSTTSNLMERYVRVAYGRLLEIVEPIY